jgi:hypothetical protein
MSRSRLGRLFYGRLPAGVLGRAIMSVRLEAPARGEIRGEQVPFFCGAAVYFSLPKARSVAAFCWSNCTDNCAFAFD